MLIPAQAFQEGGEANGRALAYWPTNISAMFGTVYDLSTVAILWFAGASAMVGLLNLVPQYLPRYGMAPEWARANRPLVLIFTAITFVVTILFEADVDAQGCVCHRRAGAHGIGALAVTISASRSGRRWFGYLLLTLIFAYTTLVNLVDRPEGLKIATVFIVGIVISSLVSRVLRSTELRVHAVEADDLVQQFLPRRRRPGEDDRQSARQRPPEEYEHKLKEAMESHHLTADESVLFIEVRPGDVSRTSVTCCRCAGSWSTAIACCAV